MNAHGLTADTLVRILVGQCAAVAARERRRLERERPGGRFAAVVLDHDTALFAERLPLVAPDARPDPEQPLAWVADASAVADALGEMFDLADELAEYVRFLAARGEFFVAVVYRGRGAEDCLRVVRLYEPRGAPVGKPS